MECGITLTGGEKKDQVMTLMEAAKKWAMSPNWVRELVKSGRVKGAKLRKDVPVPYYEIPAGTARPPSLQHAPLRKGSAARPKPASIERRKERALKRAGVKVLRKKPGPKPKKKTDTK